MNIQERVQLSAYSTIGLGGDAVSFTSLDQSEQLIPLIEELKQRFSRIPIKIIGQGSNILFPDKEVPASIIQMNLQGIEVESALTESPPTVKIHVKAGHSWDALVLKTIDMGLSQFVCLSGIPGTVGAVPIQNIGAYGVEIASSVERVDCLEINSQQSQSFSRDQCQFAYRDSIFKKNRDHYAITAVHFRLSPQEPPSLNYSELAENLDSSLVQKIENWRSLALKDQREILMKMRDVVLSLRSKKSMLINKDDIHSKSLGSFFTNPILDKKAFSQLEKTFAIQNQQVRSFPQNSGKNKIAAAWLIEQAGFKKGQRWGNIGISPNHALAFVNYGGTAAQIDLAATEIEEKIKRLYGITLLREVETYF